MKPYFYTPFIASLALSQAALAQPAVLELFTSQGCSSCPPAEALAEKFAQNDNLIVLSYHVNYWDRLGWADPYASQENTNRQRAYAAASGRVYTPEIRVNGVASVVGSQKNSIEAAIASTTPPVLLQATPTLTGWTVAWPKNLTKENIEISVVYSKTSNANAVTAGENNGRKLISTNTVSRIEQVQPPAKTETTLNLNLAKPTAGQHATLLVQQAGPGQILAVAKLK